ncbi:hypothetical protein EL17_14785 [Anditalea andensis]|uniref:Uncharacterized protein n=1 Tax=Anditalea andensis TaxID=1048983 RepID=A0A074KZ34_9BACT|nr:hypothetical protein EL17_14785 [Anditalea andensis]
MITFLRLYFVAFLLILTFESQAQKYPNSLYGEILGNGLFYSINYERNIMAKGIVFLSHLSVLRVLVEKLPEFR